MDLSYLDPRTMNNFMTAESLHHREEKAPLILPILANTVFSLLRFSFFCFQTFILLFFVFRKD